MGYALAGSVGASFANPLKDVICLIGDGGLQMCIEELATIARHKLPIKIFLFNNKGQGIIRQTIDTWLDSNYNAVDYETGLSFPDFNMVAEAYGIQTAEIKSHTDIELEIQRVLKMDGPVFCNVFINKYQQIKPQLVFGKGLEDMCPYKEELK
jgi:acetolactate synthase-1/2/3 large subunit